MFTFGGNQAGELGVGLTCKYSTWWVDASKKFGDIESAGPVVSVQAPRRSSLSGTQADTDDTLALTDLSIGSSNMPHGGNGGGKAARRSSLSSVAAKTQDLLMQVQAKVLQSRQAAAGVTLPLLASATAAAESSGDKSRSSYSSGSSSGSLKSAAPGTVKLTAGGLPSLERPGGGVDYAALPPPKYKATASVRDKLHCALVPQLIPKFTRRRVICVSSSGSHTLLVAGTTDARVHACTQMMMMAE